MSGWFLLALAFVQYQRKIKLLNLKKKLNSSSSYFTAYNSLLVRYKIYSSDPKECLCTSWRYDEACENCLIDPAPCRKNPVKK